MESEKKPVRIVFMGTTGAGKSTVVNAFYNFAQQVCWRDYPKLFPIPTDFQKCNVEKYIGKSAECHARGQLDGVTQSPVEYLVDGHDCRLHFIDCPGTGDPRGIMQDCRYAYVTAQFLRELVDFHAFCVVVKSTMNRQTIEDLYSLEQIKVVIPKKARDRIFVVVTHDSGSRENIPSFLRELDIPCENIFYFDNFGLTVEGYFEPSSIQDCFDARRSNHRKPVPQGHFWRCC